MITIDGGTGKIIHNGINVTPAPMIDSWRIDADISGGTNADITNWVAATNKMNSSLSTALTHSSGIFSFPTTGHYLLTFNARMNCGSGNDNAMNVVLKVTTDGSTYEDASLCTYGAQEGSTQSTSSISYVFDVTNTSTHKFKFATDSMASSSHPKGSSSENQTYFQIVRLADT
jgi:hypothetical protein